MDSLSQVDWAPSIGDPTFMGWFTLVAYFITALISFKLYLSSGKLFSEQLINKQKRFWLVVTLIMLFLGLNKQLDLQSLLTVIGKYYAHRDGWYEHRRIFQVSGIIAIIALLGGATVIFSYYMRAVFKANRWAIVGLCFLLLFVAIRATSFHHMDVLINTVFWGVRMNWVLELFGIFLIAMSAIAWLRNKKSVQ